MARAWVRATKHQERRRKLALRLDPFDYPIWIDQVLCRVVGRGHTAIHSYAVVCAWCHEPLPLDSPDTLPRDDWSVGWMADPI